MISQDIPYGFTIGTFLPLIITFIIRISIAFFIAKNAQKRGMEPTIYIALTCCCSCWIGGIIYLIVASNHPSQPDDLQQPTFSSNQSQIYGQSQTIYGQSQYQQPRQPTQQTKQTQPKPVYPDTSTTIPNVEKDFCPVCGSQNHKGAKYCSHCGADL